MTKLKVRGLKWKTMKVRGSVLHFCQKDNYKVTVHAFGIVHKPKITVHGQWTMPDTHPEKKRKKKAKNATQETQYPNATYMLKFAYLILFWIQADQLELNT